MLRQFIPFFLLLFLLNVTYSQSKEKEQQVLFNSYIVLDLQLELYFDSLLAGGVSEKVRYNGYLKILKQNKVLNTFKIQLSKRGHFRKFPNICDFPPLRIHFDTEETRGTEFQDLNKIKVVTHCQNNDTAFEQYVIQEYLIYKAYNLLTDYSFKVRLARIKYVDLSKTFPSVQTYTFFLENPASLEKRLNGTCLDAKYVQPQNLDQRQFALMVMFQYMVINQDWSVTLSHNLELFAKKNDFKLLPIPFDFDMCGIIAIPYKSPTVPFKKGEKPERNFMGKDIPREYIVEAMDTLRSKKNEIIKVFNTFPLLNPVDRKNIVSHISEFYDNTSDIQQINSLISLP
jgi:hypothetical protein